MEHFFTSAAVSFVALFPVVNPIAKLGQFLGLTAGMDRSERRREAVKASVASVVFMVGFLLAGHYVLNLFGVSLAAVEFAGGLLIGSVGWQMATHPESRLAPVTNDGDTVYLYPLAFPLLAGPGALAVVLSLSSRNDSWIDFPGFLVGIAGMGLVAYLAMESAEPISDRLGKNGSTILVQLLGVAVLAIGAEFVFHGIADHFGLDVVHG